MKNLFLYLFIILLVSCKTEKAEIIKNKEIATTTPSALENKKSKMDTGFIFQVGTHFNPITKTELDALRSFEYIIGKEHADRIIEYKLVDVVLMDYSEKSNTRIPGNNPTFNQKQLDYMQSLDYSTNIMIWTEYLGKNKNTGELEDTHWTPHFTIVPEKQAEYSEGEDALVKFLKDSSLEVRKNIAVENLKRAKLFFTVTKNGSIENIKLHKSCDYPEVDKKIIELIQNTPAKWNPGENTKDEKVSQEFGLSFGLMGC